VSDPDRGVVEEDVYMSFGKREEEKTNIIFDPLKKKI